MKILFPFFKSTHRQNSKLLSYSYRTESKVCKLLQAKSKEMLRQRWEKKGRENYKDANVFILQSGNEEIPSKTDDQMTEV